MAGEAEVKTKSGRTVKKPVKNYQQKLVMNSQACSKYRAKKKNKEKVGKHRMAPGQGKTGERVKKAKKIEKKEK